MTDDAPSTLLIATANKGKVAEIRSLLTGLPLAGLDAFPEIVDVAETGQTFAENSILKARGYAVQSRQWTLADDSGLEIEALNGAPGVYSARYGGEGLSDADRTQLLLETLSQSNSTDRRARFVSVVSIANPRGEIVNLSTGTCEGRIADVPRGTNGFGYDPVFVPDGFEESFGELDSYIKEKISHRAKALAMARTFLLELFSV